MLDIATLRASYDLKAPLAARFAARLSEQVEEILFANSISLAVPIESRVKSWTSLSEKVERSALKVADVVEVMDLVGLRIILLFKRDIQKVVDLVSSSLAVISAEDALDRLGVEMFGYQSIHLQAEMPSSWAGVPTLKDFAGLQAEIQIRTAAQHIWAAASHKLQYKMEASVPPQVLRSVNRVAALLETVDLEFERALAEREEYAAQTGAALKADKGAVQSEILNVDLLREVLDQLLPHENVAPDEDFADLLDDLHSAGIRQVSQLNNLVVEGLPNTLRLDKRIAQAIDKKARKLGADGSDQFDGKVEVWVDGKNYHALADRARRGVFHTHTGLVRQMLESAGLWSPK